MAGSPGSAPGLTESKSVELLLFYEPLTRRVWFRKPSKTESFSITLTSSRVFSSRIGNLPAHDACLITSWSSETSPKALCSSTRRYIRSRGVSAHRLPGHFQIYMGQVEGKVRLELTPQLLLFRAEETILRSNLINYFPTSASIYIAAV